MMNGMRPKGQVDANVLEELMQLLQQRGEAPVEDGGTPAVEVEIGGNPGGTHTMPDGSTMADSEMEGGKVCPHCGKSY